MAKTDLAIKMNFDSDEWHADETVVKILGKKYYIWFIIDSETSFVLYSTPSMVTLPSVA